MAGRGDPPQETPEGVPEGGDDDFRFVVFDESFIRAARIQEYSARERLDGAFRAVRTRNAWARGGAPRQALVLIALILVALGAAVYLGVRNPYHRPPAASSQPLRITLIALAPAGRVPAADRREPFAGQAAQDYSAGAEGITVPVARRVGGFSESQVVQALSTARDYVYASSIDPDELTGGDVRQVRSLLAGGQLAQFDRSLSSPADDGAHAATGWLVRFDPSEVRLASDEVRARGSMSVALAGSDALEVTTDHVLVYALRPADDARAAPSLFTVRRELRFRFDSDDLRAQQVELVEADVEAGPLSCGAPAVAYFRPLPAGQRAPAMTPVDPYDPRQRITGVCAALASGASAGPGTTSPPGPSSRATRPAARAGRPSAAASASGSPKGR